MGLAVQLASVKWRTVTLICTPMISSKISRRMNLLVMVWICTMM